MASMFDAELDEDVQTKAVEIARQLITPKQANWIRKEYEKSPRFWPGIEHFGLGMQLRNAFRKAGLKDNMTTTLSWDNHYAKVAELAIGIHDDTPRSERRM